MMNWFLALIRTLTEMHGTRTLFNGVRLGRSGWGTPTVDNRAARRAASSRRKRERGS